jgi:hypothetical protein
LSKIKCFACQKSGHCASQCPKKKKGQGHLEYIATFAENQLDAFAAKFEKEFTLASCLSTRTITKSAWFLDSYASHHMTESRELFRILKEDSGIHVELGGDAKYEMKSEGTILFQLELGGSFEAQDLLYVPALKKDFLSVSVMEDRGFVVMFKKGKVLVCPEESSLDTSMSIGVRKGNLYSLQVKSVQALLHDSDSLCELWNKKMGHLHYRALLIMREIVTDLPDFNID